MSTLREIMTERVKHGGPWDYCFQRGDHKAKNFAGDYVAWLNSLDDEDFLDAYDRVQEDTPTD